MKDVKQELRNIVLSSLKSFNIEKKIADSKLLHKNLKKILATENLIQAQIGIYSPLDDEIDPIFDRERLYAFPKMDSDQLKFFESNSNDLEKIKAYGREFKEPKVKERCIEPEVFIVPGLAFSAEGRRLGRGKGYYDKYFRSVQRDIVKIGVCFDEQIFDEDQIQMSSLDAFMDFVVTPSRIYQAK